MLTGRQDREVGTPTSPPSLPSTELVLGSTARPGSPGPELPAGQAFKVTPVVQGTSQGLGPEPSGVIFFFIKKQNLNQENKVIKFLLGAAGP